MIQLYKNQIEFGSVFTRPPPICSRRSPLFAYDRKFADKSANTYISNFNKVLIKILLFFQRFDRFFQRRIILSPIAERKTLSTLKYTTDQMDLINFHSFYHNYLLGFLKQKLCHFLSVFLHFRYIFKFQICHTSDNLMASGSF